MPRIYCSTPDARPGLFNGHAFARHEDRLLSVHNLDQDTADHFCSVPGFSVAHDAPPARAPGDGAPAELDVRSLALTVASLNSAQQAEFKQAMLDALGNRQMGVDRAAPGADQTAVFVPGGHAQAEAALVQNLATATEASRSAAAAAGQGKATKTVKVAVPRAPDAR